MKKTYKHLFFDLDHTLWDFDKNAREAMELLFLQMDLQQKTGVGFDEFYKSYLVHNEVMWDRYHKGFITREELKWKRMWRTLLDFKIGDEILAKEMAEEFLLVLPTRKNLFPYTIELLTYLHEKGYQLHLITNGFETTQWSKISNSGIKHFFTEVITSEGSNSMKPKAEIFEYALKACSADLDCSIMIGDNPDADIAGAINAGMDSVYVDHTDKPISLQPTYHVRNLKMLEEIF